MKRIIIYALVILTSCTKKDKTSKSVDMGAITTVSPQVELLKKYIPDTFVWNKKTSTEIIRCSSEKDELEFIKFIDTVDISKIDISKSRYEFKDLNGVPAATVLAGFIMCDDHIGLIDDRRCYSLGITGYDGSIIINRAMISEQYTLAKRILTCAGLRDKIVSKAMFMEAIIEQERWQKHNHRKASLLDKEWLSEMISIKIAGEFYICTRLLDLPEVIDGYSDPQDLSVVIPANYGKMIAGYYRAFPSEYRNGLIIDRHSGLEQAVNSIVELLKAHPDVLKRIKNEYLK